MSTCRWARPSHGVVSLRVQTHTFTLSSRRVIAQRDRLATALFSPFSVLLIPHSCRSQAAVDAAVASFAHDDDDTDDD